MLYGLMVTTGGFVAPCIPTRAAKPPAGPDWIHEIKHDGYRLIVRRDGDRVRCSPAAAMTGAAAIRRSPWPP
jgi:ATP-dependent DNA ligase